MAKKGRVKIELRSTASTHFRTTTKNPKAAKKVAKKMFDPITRSHVMYEEGKIRK